MRCHCPLNGCSSSFTDPEALRHHLRHVHRMTPRETWPLIDRLKVPGQDLEDFKREFAELAVREGC
jgi:hypothetical protein